MTTPRPADRCPGVLRLHSAADGLLARIRVPGGRMDAERWGALAAAARLGDGRLHLTSRGNVQVRGLAADSADDLEALLAGVGLAPGSTHDRMRNILASPLAGRVPGRADFGTAVPDLEAELVSRPLLSDAALSGKFLFGLDDGSGDVLRHLPDLGARFDDSGAAELVVGGAPAEVWVEVAAVPTVLADLAERFASLPGHDWRIAGDAAATEAVLAAAGAHPATRDTPPVSAPTPPAARAEIPPVGWIDAADGTVSLVAVTELAIVEARLAEFLAAIDTPSTISPERAIGIHGLSENQAEQVVRVLAPLGLIFDATSPWVSATACIGAPGCASSLAPVQDDLARSIAAGALDAGSPGAGPQHWVGCERACGWDRRSALHLATGAGYAVRPAPPRARDDDARRSPEGPH